MQGTILNAQNNILKEFKTAFGSRKVYDTSIKKKNLKKDKNK